MTDEEQLAHLLELFEIPEDPNIVELREKIMESAHNCPYDKDTCPHIN